MKTKTSVVALAASMALGGLVSTAFADGMEKARGSLKDVAEAPAGIAHAAQVEASFGSTRGQNSFKDEFFGQTFSGSEPKWERPAIAGAARVSGPIGHGLSVQVDLEAVGVLARGDVSGGSNVLAGVHLAHRDPSRGAIGAFAAAGVYDQAFGDGNVRMLGLEAQRYIGPVTLYAQAGLLDLEVPSQKIDSSGAWFVRGVVRYFHDPRSRLQAYVSYAEGDLEQNLGVGNIQKSTFDSLGWGLRFDRQFAERPLSWFVAYDASKTEVEQLFNGGKFTQKATDHAFRVGLSFKFGTESLQDNDRRGATFDLPRLPVAGQRLFNFAN